MARFNAQEVVFSEMIIRGVEGIYADCRIDRSTVPQGLCFYELRDDSSDGIPCQYKAGIMVDFCGTFISKEPLPDKNDGFFEESELAYVHDGITLQEYVAR